MREKLTIEDLIEISQNRGFPIVGVTDAAPLHTFATYQQWIRAGSHGEMHYLEKSPALEIRANPGLFLPSARSILVMGARYAINRGNATGEGLYGQISSYAWGSDYHLVLQKQAQQVADDLARYTNQPLQTRTAVDSAPVLEKPMAQRAGLGWQGKNTCLINPRQGSFFFLITIFTSLEVVSPVPPNSTEHCGTCHSCLDACPTGCILPDRTIDARRCLSYLTIEKKGVIPMDLRPKLGRNIFGCDVCQSVCPWNHKPDDSSVPADFLPRSEADIAPDLLSLIHLSETEFKIRFKNSPIQRTKRRGLLRNIAVVLGNYRSAEAEAPLAFLLQNDPDPLVRSHAAWGLGCVPASNARTILSGCLKTEPDAEVLAEITRALEES